MKWSLRIMKTVYKLILVIMVLVLFVSCTGKEKDNSNLEIKSEEQVQEVVNNVHSKISVYVRNNFNDVISYSFF